MGSLNVLSGTSCTTYSNDKYNRKFFFHVIKEQFILFLSAVSQQL